MVDIRELARQSGVSVATVSRALNGHPEVSAATRQRIVDLADRLGYQPSQAARALVRGRSDMIGLIWDTSYEAEGRRQPFLQDMLTGVKRALSNSGYHLMLLSTVASRTEAADVEAYVRVARQHRLAAVLLMGIDEHHPAVTALVDAAEVPCVGLDLPVHGPRATYVTSDNRVGAARAVRHLHSLGHSRIATITGPMDLMPATERLDGYRYELARLGLPYSPEYVRNGDFFLASGYRCAQELLALPSPPTALFAAGDEMAIGALQAALDAGLRVPEDLAVVGFDDVEAAGLVRPGLTTIAQDREGLARAAVGALRDLIDQPRTAARQAAGGAGGGGDEAPQPASVTLPPPRIVATKLLVRASCGGTAP